MKKKLALFFTFVTINIVLILISTQNVFAKSMTVNFPSSTSQSQSQTVNIPNLKSIDSISVDTGTVGYTVSGNNVTINVSNGSGSSSGGSWQYCGYGYYSASASQHVRSTQAQAQADAASIASAFAGDWHSVSGYTGMFRNGSYSGMTGSGVYNPATGRWDGWYIVVYAEYESWAQNPTTYSYTVTLTYTDNSSPVIGGTTKPSQNETL